MVQQNPKPEKSVWLESLHVAGSIASVSGISLLILNRAISAMSVLEIVAVIMAVSISLGILMVIIWGLIWWDAKLAMAGTFWRISFWLTVVPILIFILVPPWIGIFKAFIRDVPMVFRGS